MKTRLWSSHGYCVAHDLGQEAAGVTRLQGIELLALHVWRGHQGCELRTICFLPNPLKPSHAAVAEQLPCGCRSICLEQSKSGSVWLIMLPHSADGLPVIGG